MQPENSIPKNEWDEQNTQIFIDYGRYFVPERERQLQMIVDLVPHFDQASAVIDQASAVIDQASAVIDLACGEGLLSELILERFPGCTVYGLDGSAGMLQRAQERLSRFGERFQARPFDLFARSWPDISGPLQAVVSSLAIHHLDGSQKQALFREIQELLAPGGAFIIADLVEPTHPVGWELAAKAWDEAVRKRAMELDGNLEGFYSFERQRWNTYRYFDPQDIDKPSPLFNQLKWLELAGFSAVDAYWMYAGHAIFGGFKPGREP